MILQHNKNLPSIPWDKVKRRLWIFPKKLLGLMSYGIKEMLFEISFALNPDVAMRLMGKDDC
jgi:hypothetical protein